MVGTGRKSKPFFHKSCRFQIAHVLKAVLLARRRRHGAFDNLFQRHRAREFAQHERDRHGQFHAKHPSDLCPQQTAKIFIAQSLMQPLDPIVVTQTPAHAATNISTAANIVLQFSKRWTPTPSKPRSPRRQRKWAHFGWSALHDTMTFTPSTVWSSFTTNLIHLATNATDAVDGNTFFAPFDAYFVTSTNNRSSIDSRRRS